MGKKENSQIKNTQNDIMHLMTKKRKIAPQLTKLTPRLI